MAHKYTALYVHLFMHSTPPQLFLRWRGMCRWSGPGSLLIWRRRLGEEQAADQHGPRGGGGGWSPQKATKKFRVQEADPVMSTRRAESVRMFACPSEMQMVHASRR